MCGIAGKYYFGRDGAVAPAVIEAMTDIVSYRGPDDSGFYIRKNIGLGFRRLSILDLSSAGHQPMCNEDGTIWVVFNGEIYNYKTLRAHLESKGHVFKSNTDTEVIVHAYEEDPIDFVRKFSGMFAFAIWDEPRQRLVLARDQFGIKPLYYFEKGKFLSFASEIKSILQDHDVPRNVDDQALSNFLSLHYVPAPRTMFADIRKLMPGHMLVAERGTYRIQKFWELTKSEPVQMSEAALADFVYSELKDSVRQRLQSDVRVGTLLSGGVDSSSMLGLMTELTGQPVPAFSVGYSEDGDDGFSEFTYSRLAASRFRADYHEIVVTSEMFLDFLPKAIWHQDEPIGEPAAIPLYYTCRMAKECGVTVLLSGEGADELFAGYNRYLGESVSEYYGRLPGICHVVAEQLLRLVPRLPRLMKGHHSMSQRNWWDRYQSWHTVFSRDMKAELLDRRYYAAADSYADAYDGYRSYLASLDNLDKLMWLDLKVWLPDDLLVKKDKMGMAASVEARVPFLDHRFAELMFNIPANMKVRHLTGKYIFKKSMERLLPKEIIYRKKAGFPTPISKWMASAFSKQVADILLDSGTRDHGYFDRRVVKRLLDEHASGRINHERLLFPLLNFDLWYRLFFSETKTAQPESTPARMLV
ncbi:MAG TPA: asparagine synthase (glutamine-hydrolyzing) [Terriglobales bacterium]|nr:asparagine synthase (glutamine-hydrolyzing) [Terriglobales bacterium]